jgi:hypothetical protein
MSLSNPRKNYENWHEKINANIEIQGFARIIYVELLEVPIFSPKQQEPFYLDVIMSR